MRRPAFTLIEMVMSLAIASVLAVAITSAIFIATRSVPKADDRIVLSGSLLALNEVLRTEVETAKALDGSSGTHAAVTVADRDDDDTDETLRVEWDGMPEGSVRANVNGGSWMDVVTPIESVDVTVRQTSGDKFQGTQAVAGIEGGSDLRSVSAHELYLPPGTRVGVRIQPELLDGQIWRLKGVQIDLARRTDPDGTGEVTITITNDSNVPSDDDRYCTFTVPLSDLEAAAVSESFPTRTPWLAHDEPAVLKLENTGSSGTFHYYVVPGASPIGAQPLMDFGASWVPSIGFVMSMEITYEVATEPVPDASATWVESIEFAANAPTVSASPTPITVRPLGQPEVP